MSADAKSRAGDTTDDEGSVKGGPFKLCIK